MADPYRFPSDLPEVPNRTTRGVSAISPTLVAFRLFDVAVLK